MDSVLTLLRRVVPRASWARVRELRNRHRLRRGLARLRALAPGAPLPADTMGDLVTGWDNHWSIRQELIAELWHHAWTTPGPLLDVGSGLSTFVLGIVAERRGLVVTSLEHDAAWHREIGTLLLLHDVRSVRLHLAPLQSGPGYDWYTLPADLPGDLAMVACDGPPWDTRGGRYGLLPELASHLAPGCVVLLDDAARPGEQAALARWGSEFGCQWELRGHQKPFAVIRLPGIRST